MFLWKKKGHESCRLRPCRVELRDASVRRQSYSSLHRALIEP
jgi:hypothetical protein